MAIKVEVINVPEDKYPCLKISFKGIIVEFISDKTGRVEVGKDFYAYGYTSTNWNMHDFEPFTGKLVKFNHAG